MEEAERSGPPERGLTENERQRAIDLIAEHELNKGVHMVPDKGSTRRVKKPLSPILLPAADVEIREPEWLIHGYIPKNGITIIAGEGGVGKTSIWCNIVAAVTSGKQSFMEHDIPYGGNPQNVVVFSAEDSWEYVLKQRLINNGADLNRISFLSPADERFSELNFNGNFLKEIIEANRPPLIIFDPVQAFVPENLKMGDRNAMRKCFSPLMGYGETYNLTSIIIAHANKQGNVWGRKRLADSSDIWDAARSVLMVGTTKDNIRYIAHEKSNWGKLQESVLFDLDNGVPAFKAYTNKKDKDFILADQYNNRTAPALEEAKEFILDFLKDGQKEVSELDEMAKVDGISKNALKDAKAALKKEGVTHTWSIGFNPKKYIISLTATEKTNEYDKK